MNDAIKRTDCVLDAQENEIIIWHVDTGAEFGLSRMAGAWVFGAAEQEIIASLVTDRRVLATSTGEHASAQLGISVSHFIEPPATVANLIAERDTLQAMYEAHPRMANLVAPNWPFVPPAVDPQDPPMAEAPGRTRRALGLARWLETIAQTWDRIERERAMRSYMPSGSSRRPTPLATRAEAR